jgi:hypothetical protein
MPKVINRVIDKHDKTNHIQREYQIKWASYMLVVHSPQIITCIAFFQRKKKTISPHLRAIKLSIPYPDPTIHTLPCVKPETTLHLISPGVANLW